MRHFLIREYVLSVASLVILACNLRAQDAAPMASTPPQQGAPLTLGKDNHPQAIGGPGMSGPPQPFPEAKSIAPPTNDDELAAAIKQLAGELASSGRFSGSVVVAADGKQLVDNAWGEADRENKVPNTAETSYDVGSIGKLFTQIAILQLADASKLSLDEPLGKHLAQYPNQDIAGKVTIRQLLLHTSGMGDIFDSVTPKTNLSSMRELRDFLPLFAQKPLEFTPGSKTHYSNVGYIVLGMVIEAVSGENYYDYIEKHVLKPAGMSHSGFFDRSKLPPSVAHSYEDGRDVTNTHAVRGSPAGGLQASAGDLFRLVQAIDAGKVVGKQSLRTLRDLIPRPPNAPPAADETKLAAYGLAGGAPGVSGQVAIDPTGRYTRVILCNSSPPMAMSMAATITAWLKQMQK